MPEEVFVCFHFVARMRHGRAALANPVHARWLWRRLRRLFPKVLAAVLMVDHVHLLMRTKAPAGSRRKLAALLASFSRRFGLGELWERLPEPTRVEGVHKRRRNVRYVLLNPARPCFVRGRWIKLTTDPLAWPWSTYRDVMGAAANPWVDSEDLAVELEMVADDFRERFHRYVSSDPDVAVEGTALPRTQDPPTVATQPLADIALAAAAAAREPAEALGRRTASRRIFVALAQRQGWRDHRQIAATCGITTAAVRRLGRSCPPQWLEAGAMCLADARLRKVFDAKVP